MHLQELQKTSIFPYPDPSLDYVNNISNPFYVERRTELNLFSDGKDTSTSEFLFLLAQWFVLFGFIMEVNVLVYKITQQVSILAIFKKKGHQQFNEFLAAKKTEYRAYTIATMLLSGMALAQSTIEYFMWRGTQYFAIPEPYSMACSFLNDVKNGTTMNCTDWRKYDNFTRAVNYSRYQHGSTCSNEGRFTSGVHACLLQNNFIVVVIIFGWYALRFFTNSLNLFFIFVLLDRNNKGSKGPTFFKPHLKKSIFWCSLVVGGELLLLNSPYNYRLYFHFETLGVLIIVLFEKVLLFFVLFDRYSVKDWTDNKLRSKHIHVKGIEWRDEYNAVMQTAFQDFRQKFAQRKRTQRFYQDREVEILAVYEQNFERYAEQLIFEKHFWSYDHKPEKLFEVAWSKYINYLLVVTFLGMSGYFLMILPTANAYEDRPEMARTFSSEERFVFLVGYFLAMLEIVLLRITKDIYLTNTLFRDITVLFESRSKKLKCEYFSEF